MGSREELVKLIEEQIGIEKESVAKFAETETKVHTGTAGLLLCEMRMDSQKHASVLEAVLKILKTYPSSKPRWEQAFGKLVDRVVVKREIEKHKALGKSMRARLAREMWNTRDEMILALLGHLAQEERRHNEILDTMTKKCDTLFR
jgi:hypothetical protein